METKGCMKISAFLTLLILSSVSFLNAQYYNNPNTDGILGQVDFISKNSGTSSTLLNGPNGIAIDPTSGKLFVVDRANNRILRWSKDNSLINNSSAEAVFGQTDFESKSSGLSESKFNTPIGIFIDNEGRMWVGDYGNNRILRFDDASNKTTGAAADGVLGQPDFYSKVGNTSVNGLRGPVGLYVDSDGTLWVSEFGNHRVTKYLNASIKTNGSNADGVLGQPDFTTSNSSTSAIGMNNPNSVFVDNDGNLWVSEYTNKRVLKFTDAKNKINGAAADGVLGQPDFTSSSSNVTQNGFTNLRYVFGDSKGRIYVVQENSHRIVIFEDAKNKSNGSNADYVWGQIDFNTSPALNPPTSTSYNTPRAIFVDEQNNHIWVADWGNNRILRYDIQNTVNKSLNLISPNGGENFLINSSQNILWTSNLVNKIVIEFSSNAGNTWNIIDTTDADSGFYSWTIPNTPTSSALIRIYDLEDSLLSDTSSDTFSISAPSKTIHLISPNGFQEWENGTTKKIFFSGKDISNINIYFSTDSGKSWQEITKNYLTTSGDYLWKIPDLLSSSVLIKISDTEDTLVSDISDNFFSIVEKKQANIQDYVFFSDSPTSNYYDPSWGFANPPSTLEIVGNKFPVTNLFSLVGNYSLKLNWNSAIGGDWGIAVASIGWIGHDITTKDTLSLRVFSEKPILPSKLPLIYLEDLSNKKTYKIKLSSYSNYIDSLKWNQIKVPLSVFKKNAGSADLTKIKTIFFGQDTSDNVQNTVYLDDIRMYGGKIISGDSSKVIVVLGSSTAAGTGASSSDSSWVGRFRNYVHSFDSTAYVINLAVGGYTTYDVMPSYFIPPASRPTPKTNNNITFALSYKPQAIIINLPSNDANMGYTVSEQLANFKQIINEATLLGTKVWATTTQPRDFAESTKRQNLITVKDSILLIYGENAINVWDGLAQTNGMILSQFNSGDGIHLNDKGHRFIFNKVVERGIWDTLTTKIDEVKSDLIPEKFHLYQNFPNPFNPETKIIYEITKPAYIKLKVYDILGRELVTLADNFLPVGRYTVNFSAKNISSGVYFVKLQSGTFEKMIKMLLLK